MRLLTALASHPNRKHAALRCYLDMERFVKPQAQELEALLKMGDVDSDRAKRVSGAAPPRWGSKRHHKEDAIAVVLILNTLR